MNEQWLLRASLFNEKKPKRPIYFWRLTHKIFSSRGLSAVRLSKIIKGKFNFRNTFGYFGHFFLDLTGRSWWWCFKFFKPLKLNWIFPSGTWTKERRLPILKSRSTLRTCKYASFNFDEKIMQEFFASKVSFLLELKKNNIF